MPPKIRLCAIPECVNEVPGGSRPNKKFCSPRCRKLASNRRIAARKVASRDKSPLTPAMQEFRRLLDSDEDFVRTAMEDAVRAIVTEHVKDNILGAAEIITGLLPRVLAGLSNDLESKDWMIRSRAQAAVLKYAMEFRDKENSDKDLGNINVHLSTSLPNTPLGHATQAEIVVLESGEIVEDFEHDYWKCWKCGDRHPKEAMRGTEKSPICSSCLLAQSIADNGSDPGAMLHRDPEFGRGER